MEKFSHTLHKLRKALNLTQTEMAEKMGLSLSYIHQLESEKRTPSANVERLVRMMIEKQSAGFGDGVLNDTEAVYQTSANFEQQCLEIPIVGMAHAGINEDYDEAAPEWRETMVTTCPDEDARGIRVIGICMSPNINEDDILVLMPSRKPRSGGISVARIKGGGVIIRRFQFTLDHKVTAIADNVQVPVEYYTEEDFEWIWPVWDMHRKIWRD